MHNFCPFLGGFAKLLQRRPATWKQRIRILNSRWPGIFQYAFVGVENRRRRTRTCGWKTQGKGSFDYHWSRSISDHRFLGGRSTSGDQRGLHSRNDARRSDRVDQTRTSRSIIGQTSAGIVVRSVFDWFTPQYANASVANGRVLYDGRSDRRSLELVFALVQLVQIDGWPSHHIGRRYGGCCCIYSQFSTFVSKIQIVLALLKMCSKRHAWTSGDVVVSRGGHGARVMTLSMTSRDC